MGIQLDNLGKDYIRRRSELIDAVTWRTSGGSPDVYWVA